MSAFTCEIIGTGDGKLENLEKIASPPSTSMVKGIVEDIVENVLDILEDSYVAAPREKSPCFFGTGDQKSEEDIKTKISYFPRVEKKTRLTDLVRNSKQILQKMMMSESKTIMQEQERKAEEEQEKLIQAIDLDCIQLSEHKIIIPEEVPLPRNDSEDILTPFDSDSNEPEQTDSIKIDLETSKDSDQSISETSNEPDLISSSDLIEIELNNDHVPSIEESSPTVKNLVESSDKDISSKILVDQSNINEIGLDTGKDFEQSDTGSVSIAKKLMTFPRATTSRAKAALTAKCRTLKREATILKKKKWNVSSRIANFFRKRKSIKKEQNDEEITKE